MNKLMLLVRNLLCALLALVLIASGRVRRARKRALSEPVVTALYFHKPAAKLFHRCIGWLRSHGYVFVSAAEVEALVRQHKPAPPGAVWLSFDDACRELLTAVWPVVQQYRIPVTLFIPSGIVGGAGQYPWMEAGGTARQALTVDQVKGMARTPMVTVGSHTASHPNITRCSEAEVGRELSESKRVLESWTGSAVTLLSYPFGDYDERVVRAVAAAGYTLAATVENAFVTAEAHPYRVPRFSVADNITFLEAICNMVGVWRPAIEPVKSFVGRLRGAGQPQAKPAPKNLGQRSTAPVTRV